MKYIAIALCVALSGCATVPLSSNGDPYACRLYPKTHLALITAIGGLRAVIDNNNRVGNTTPAKVLDAYAVAQVSLTALDLACPNAANHP